MIMKISKILQFLKAYGRIYMQNYDDIFAQKVTFIRNVNLDRDMLNLYYTFDIFSKIWCDISNEVERKFCS